MDDAVQSTVPTTLRAFDMVVAISEEAINKQLDLLYHTPLKPLPLPEPGTTQPAQEYLIQRAVTMNYPETDIDGNVTPSDNGIYGWIAPPAVTINPRDRMSSTVTLKFIPNPDLNATGDTNSYYKEMKHFKRGGVWVHEEAKTNINNWAVSWNCDLKATNIQSVQEEILAQALPPDTVKQISEYVKNEAFLVSSIFCLMESAKLTNTLRITDATGKEPATGSWATTFVLSLLSWLGVDEKNPGSDGLPTARNPFVLGYGISQVIPPSPGVPLFAPRFFQFTTSAAEPGKPKGPGASTLNFCIKTKDKVPINTHTDGNAGLFAPSLMERVAYVPEEADGVMVVSNGLMFDEILKKYFITPFEKINFYEDIKGLSERMWDIDVDRSENLGPALGHYRRYRKAIGYDGPRDTKRSNMLIQEKTNWFVWENFQCDLDSDPVPPIPHPTNVHRRAFVTVRVQNMTQSRLETSPRGSSNWSDASNAYVWVNLKFRYMLTSKDDGSWIVELLKSESHVPEQQDAPGPGQERPIKWNTERPGRWPNMVHGDPDRNQVDSYDYGLYSWGDREGFFSVSGDTGLDAHKAIISGWVNPDVVMISDALNKVSAELSAKLILPAGNVFTFRGLNVDAKGNLFSGITYNSLTNGERFVPEALKKPVPLG